MVGRCTPCWNNHFFRGHLNFRVCNGRSNEAEPMTHEEENTGWTTYINLAGWTIVPFSIEKVTHFQLFNFPSELFFFSIIPFPLSYIFMLVCRSAIVFSFYSIVPNTIKSAQWLKFKQFLGWVNRQLKKTTSLLLGWTQQVRVNQAKVNSAGKGELSRYIELGGFPILIQKAGRTRVGFDRNNLCPWKEEEPLESDGCQLLGSWAHWAPFLGVQIRKQDYLVFNFVLNF